MSNGNVLYGEDGEDINGTNFNNEAGVEVLQWIADQKIIAVSFKPVNPRCLICNLVNQMPSFQVLGQK